jgi:hypothetical protein
VWVRVSDLKKAIKPFMIFNLEFENILKKKLEKNFTRSKKNLTKQKTCLCSLKILHSIGSHWPAQNFFLRRDVRYTGAGDESAVFIRR